MEPVRVPDLTFPPVLLAEWAEAINADVQKTLERMDRIMQRTESELRTIRESHEHRLVEQTEHDVITNS